MKDENMIDKNPTFLVFLNDFENCLSTGFSGISFTKLALKSLKRQLWHSFTNNNSTSFDTTWQIPSLANKKKKI